MRPYIVIVTELTLVSRDVYTSTVWYEITANVLIGFQYTVHLIMAISHSLPKDGVWFHAFNLRHMINDFFSPPQI